MSQWEKIWKYSLVFVLIHMSSGASSISLSNAALASFSTIVLGLSFYRKVRIDKQFYIFTFIFLGLTLLYLTQFGWLNFTSTARLYLKILFAYFTMKLVGWKFLNISEDIIGKLAIISLPLFAIQLLAPEFMMKFNGFTEFIIPQVDKGPGVDYSNSILYTVNPWGLDRNSGFMWEPGAFAAMLSVGMFINMIIYGFKWNWKLFAMLLALITTTSTTGFALIGLLGIFWLLNQKLKTQLLSIPVFALAMAFIFSLPSVTDKVEDRVKNWDKTIENQDSYAEERTGISIGRIGSLYLDWEDLKKYPVIGFGQQETERITGRYIDLVRANGLSDFMVRFGIVGMLFLVWSLTRTFTRIGRWYGGRGFWMGTVIVLTLSFSNPVLMVPFFLALMFYYIAFEFRTDKNYAESSYRHTYT